MTTESSKEIKYLWLGFLFVCILMVSQVLYIRKKFDDNIKILQSSENSMAVRVQSIEQMLVETRTQAQNPNPPQNTAKDTADKQ